MRGDSDEAWGLIKQAESAIRVLDYVTARTVAERALALAGVGQKPLLAALAFGLAGVGHAQANATERALLFYQRGLAALWLARPSRGDAPALPALYERGLHPCRDPHDAAVVAYRSLLLSLAARDLADRAAEAYFGRSAGPVAWVGEGPLPAGAVDALGGQTGGPAMAPVEVPSAASSSAADSPAPTVPVGESRDGELHEDTDHGRPAGRSDAPEQTVRETSSLTGSLTEEQRG
jgi:hypothetical protein